MLYVLLPLLALILIVLLLWLPVGVQTTGIAEEWDFYALASSGVPLIPSSAWSAEHQLRPFVALPFAVGYWLSPNSFVGLNLAMIAIFIGKALTMYAVLHLLFPKESILPFGIAALFVLFPADTSTMALRTVNIHFTLLLCLTATTLLILHWHKPKIYLLILMTISLVISFGTYEISIIFALFVPLLLVWLEKRISRRVIFYSALWYLPLAIFLGWYLFMLSQVNTTYQSGLLSSVDGVSLTQIIGNFSQSIFHGLNWNFFQGWQRAVVALSISPNHVLIAIVAACLTFVVALIQTKDIQPFRHYKLYYAFAAVGLALVLLFFAPYSLSPQYMAATERVFYFTAIGGALCTYSVVFLTCRILPIRRVAFPIMLSILVGLGMVNLLNQQQYYANWSRRQQILLASIGETLPHIRNDQVTIILISSGAIELINNINPFYNDQLFKYYYNFTYALRYFYRSSLIKGLVCPTIAFCEDGLAKIRRDRSIFLEYVPFTGGVMMLEEIPEEYQTFLTGGSYNPHALIDQDAPPPERASTVLTVCWPPERCYPSPVSTVSVDFDQLITSGGWRGPEVNPDATTFQWTISQEAVIQFPPMVNSDTYALTCRVLGAMSPEILDSLVVQINGHPVAVSRQLDELSATIYQASIPGEFFNESFNEIRFTTDDPVVPEGGIEALGIAFDWLRIEPATP